MKNLKNTIKNFDTRAFRLKAIKLAITACMVAMMCGTALTAYAANGENATPAGAGGSTTMTALVNVVFWIIRIAILIIGGGPALIKIVQGQTDENPRDRNSGIAALVITGAAFGATFLVQGLI